MTLKVLPIAVLAATLASGAFAQTAPTQETGPAPAVDPTTTSSLEDINLMQPFFTDDTMTTMRPMEEMKSAWAAMSEENRTTMLRDCEGNQSIKYREFCGAIGDM